MVIVKFLFYKIYTFYSRYWPSNDPEIYAYFATTLVISLNIFTLHFFYLIVTNPSQNINVYLTSVIIASSLALVYFSVLKNGRYKHLTAKDFKGLIFRGNVGNAAVMCYILLTFFMAFMLAFQVRQYHV